jgi:hypothetical protein
MSAVKSIKISPFMKMDIYTKSIIVNGVIVIYLKETPSNDVVEKMEAALKLAYEHGKKDKMIEIKKVLEIK